MIKKNKSLFFGKVISICSSDIWVETEKGVYSCIIKGSLKKQRLDTDNLVVVGDNVKISITGFYAGVIEETEERRSFLFRGVSQNKYHVMVANVDLILITVTLDNFSQNLIDRYIVMSLKGNIQPVIIVNKWDLDICEEKRKEIEQSLEYYKSLGIQIFITSCLTLLGISKLKAFTKNKTNMFLGQSGVGKTSLFNQLTGKNYLIQKTNQKTGKGLHTTTRSVLISTQDAWYVDSPGIRLFSLYAITPIELQKFFIDIANKANFCKYSSCLHNHEPYCAVKLAVQEGVISKQRLESYYILLEELRSRTKRREREFIFRQKKKD